MGSDAGVPFPIITEKPWTEYFSYFTPDVQQYVDIATYSFPESGYNQFNIIGKLTLAYYGIETSIDFVARAQQQATAFSYFIYGNSSGTANGTSLVNYYLRFYSNGQQRKLVLIKAGNDNSNVMLNFRCYIDSDIQPSQTVTTVNAAEPDGWTNSASYQLGGRSATVAEMNAGLAGKQNALNRTVQTDLASTSAATDTGGNITPGVKNTLPVASGGTGAATKAAARINLGVQPRAAVSITPNAGSYASPTQYLVPENISYLHITGAYEKWLSFAINQIGQLVYIINSSKYTMHVKTSIGTPYIHVLPYCCELMTTGTSDNYDDIITINGSGISPNKELYWFATTGSDAKAGYYSHEFLRIDYSKLGNRRYGQNSELVFWGAWDFYSEEWRATPPQLIRIRNMYWLIRCYENNGVYTLNKFHKTDTDAEWVNDEVSGWGVSIYLKAFQNNSQVSFYFYCDSNASSYRTAKVNVIRGRDIIEDGCVYLLPPGEVGWNNTNTPAGEIT